LIAPKWTKIEQLRIKKAPFRGLKLESYGVARAFSLLRIKKAPFRGLKLTASMMPNRIAKYLRIKKAPFRGLKLRSQPTLLNDRTFFLRIKKAPFRGLKRTSSVGLKVSVCLRIKKAPFRGLKLNPFVEGDAIFIA